MVGAYKQESATVNQITTLLETKATDVPTTERANFLVQKLAAHENWEYPYTVENPCGTQSFKHWRAQFNTAIIQIVSAEFQAKNRITKDAQIRYGLQNLIARLLLHQGNDKCKF